MADSEDFPQAAETANLFDFIPDQHESGYEARLRGSGDFQSATLSWRAGWRDADIELRARALAREIFVPDEPAPRNPRECSLERMTEHWDAAEAGRNARVCELPFEKKANVEWKRSWVKTDIRLALDARYPPPSQP